MTGSLPPCRRGRNTVASGVIWGTLIGSILLLMWLWLLPVWAQDTGNSALSPTSKIDVQWGGYLRGIGTMSFPDDRSIYGLVGAEPYEDGQAELRLKNQIFIGSRWIVETHYELVGQIGDTLEKTHELDWLLPPSTVEELTGTATINDDRRLFNLTHTLSAGDNYVTYHRLDRLNLTYTPDWGTVRIGRQALTWGNGFIFNPMDLFNPFPPTTILRDYKVGDDMAFLQLPAGAGDLQLLYVPRRDPADGHVEGDQSSFAGKLHLTTAGSLEMNFMAARHYGDDVFGLGAVGVLGGAAWRTDAVYTLLTSDAAQDGFLQLTANLDYAWQWGGRNFYGFIEFYYDELGRTERYDQALNDVPLRQRLERGELFTLGKTSLAAQLEIELHPLVHAYWTAIVNLSDPSSILQPRLVWDATSNLQLIAGAAIYWGGHCTEYGGFDTTVAGRTVEVAPADQLYLWLTYNF
jgi:hypothetical protein